MSVREIPNYHEWGPDSKCIWCGISRPPEIALEEENLELRQMLQRFMDFQISDYDRVSGRAKDYCKIRRAARKLLDRKRKKVKS